MNAKHTPGPWHRNIRPARKYSIVFAGRNTHVAAIQSSKSMSDDEVEANCDLIAAAPELADALKDLVSWLEDCQRDFEGEFSMDDALAPARAALSKAQVQS